MVVLKFVSVLRREKCYVTYICYAFSTPLTIIYIELSKIGKKIAFDISKDSRVQELRGRVAKTLSFE